MNTAIKGYPFSDPAIGMVCFLDDIIVLTVNGSNRSQAFSKIDRCSKHMNFVSVLL